MQCRWPEILSGFDFKWEWMKGSSNLVDPLSRQAKLLTTIAEFETPSVELLQNIQDGYAQDSLFLDASKHFSFDGKFWRKDSLCLTAQISDADVLLFIMILLTVDISAFLGLLIS